MSTLQASVLWWTIAVVPFLAWYLSFRKFGRSGLVPALTGVTLSPVVAVVWYNFSEFGDSLAPGLVGIIGTVVFALLGFCLNRFPKVGRPLMHFSLVWALVGWHIWNGFFRAANALGAWFVVIVVVAVIALAMFIIGRATKKPKPAQPAKAPSADTKVQPAAS